ncbi:FkbM family methyltransferase [Cellulomonas sp. URHE0023]|uniref:FkbM family methyltransferase n=1 Tax=Cellulomonas sp. URHE0023 TaxID=1380354 RepID=UPI0006912F21|nr:FkbM family methyltransferase [Cellulomonas sp. URHE0023]
MQSPPFISYAQNGEDVVLWRALQHVGLGTYVEVGANHPSDDSATRAFYDRGWSGVTVEPVPAFAALQRRDRPRDTLVEAAISTVEGDVTLHLIPESGLSTLVDTVSEEHERRGISHEDVVVPAVRLEALLDDAGLAGKDIHFLLIDVEGAEADVLASVDLTVWRPWVLVVESTAPNSTEQTHDAWQDGVLAAGYEFCLFDGVSRFYVAAERASELRAALSYPACVLDRYVTRTVDRLVGDRGSALADAVHWRTLALTAWADAVAASTPREEPVPDAGLQAEAEHLRAQITALQHTVSWRVTRPLRGVRRVAAHLRPAR